MQPLNRTTAGVGPAPTEAVLQFGGGNFLRAYAEWIVAAYNRQAKVPLGVLVANNSDRKIYREWQAQDGLFHLLTRGLRDGEVVDHVELITNVSRIISLDGDWETFLASAEQPDMRYVFSNTTEAGIRYVEGDGLDGEAPEEFPARLAAWLHRRFRFFGGAAERGCIIFPFELIADNGERLRELLLHNAAEWGLGSSFADWVNAHCVFCNTLVDRIVPGISAADRGSVMVRLGYEDAAATQAEPYHLLAIEAPQAVRDELPLHRLGLNIRYVDDLTPYRRSKVAILNGAHTAMVPVGYLSGLETVKDTMDDKIAGAFVRELVYEEIIPTLSLPEVDLQEYARAVLDRFRNPFIDHRLLSISLNSVTKFRTRVLPTLLDYLDQRGSPPARMVLAWAALMHFYRGQRNGEEIPLRDDPWALGFLRDAWAAVSYNEAGMRELSRRVLGWEQAWGTDLSDRKELLDALAAALYAILRHGMEDAVSLIQNV